MPGTIEDRAERPASRLRLPLPIALSLIALIALASLLFTQRSITRLQREAHEASVAGRQRMLCQKIVKTAYSLSILKDPALLTAARAQLSQDMELWQAAQKGLQQGDPLFALAAPQSAAMIRLLDAARRPFEAITATVRQAAESADGSPARAEALQTLYREAPLYMDAMDSAQQRIDQESFRALENARLAQIVLTALILLFALLAAFPRPGRSGKTTGSEARKHTHPALDALFAAAPSALLLIDQQTLEIEHCNQKAVQLLGSTAEAIMHQPIGAFVDILQESNKLFLGSLSESKPEAAEHEIFLLDAQHNTIEVLANSQSVLLDGKPHVFVALTNNTEMKKAQEALHYHATFDEMTGLVNRRTGLLLLEKEMARSQRDSMPLTVAFVDLDGLKTVNDQFGIEEGDWMICRAAEILAESIRLGDEAIRLGGDEFLLVLHNCQEEGSRILLQRIEERLTQVTVEAQKPFPLIASMGLAIYDPARHAQVHQLIAEADRRMYLAKQLKKSHHMDFA
jgi:diguanylate cyclase (GGDEF)-like protein